MTPKKVNANKFGPEKRNLEVNNGGFSSVFALPNGRDEATECAYPNNQRETPLND